MLHWCQIISVPFGLVIDRKTDARVEWSTEIQAAVLINQEHWDIQLL